MLRRLVVLTMSLIVVACPAENAANWATGEAFAQEGASAEVVATVVDSFARTVQFVAYIRHSHDYTVEGITTRWEAYDATGAAVVTGSRPLKQPPILAGMAFPYVDGNAIPPGAEPTTVRVFVEDAGLRTDRLPRIFPVDSVEVTEDPAWQFGLRRHLVVATLTTDGEPVRRRAVVAQFILKDANGAVVGGAFTRPDNWAEIIEPDSRVQVHNEFVMATARAESVEVVAYARPE
jgi:hypothetical protein